MKPNVIHNWLDLKEWGIDYLTGEACNLSLRILCDVTSEGHALLEELFRVKIQLNRPVNGDYGSVMIPRGLFRDLAVFCIVHDYDIAIVRDGDVIGVSEEEYNKHRDIWASYFTDFHVVRPYKEHPHVGFSNVHHFSGSHW